ncbi:DEAD box helicase [Colletotrichum tofieldiae]|nr:DEAD box helicase [Colletotrichum tofieldiae]GKT92770.1 DEAD box helicase [Colletotrichum tofieldiae]
MKEAAELPRENRLDAVYPNKDVYLEVKYRLLRHEGVEPIRRAVDKQALTLELQVFVRGVNIIRLGVMVRVTFSAMRARHLINCPASQRLLPGTAVALSPALDNFQTRCVVAAMAGRYDELINSPMTPPPLDLEIPDAKITAGLMEPD